MINKNGTVLVLDIDSTLVDTHICRDVADYLLRDVGRSVDSRITKMKNQTYQLKFDVGGPMSGFYRQHLEQFMKTAHQCFDNVGIWSAGDDEYVPKMVREIYDHSFIPENKCAFVKSRSYCAQNVDKDYYKPLSKLCDEYGFNINKMVIIDDTKITFGQNKANAIHIPAFEMKNLNRIDAMVDEYYKDHALQTLIPVLQDLQDHFKNGGTVKTYDMNVFNRY